MPMDNIFSVEDISDLLWPGPISSPVMSRCPSEWDFEKFLEDFPVSVPAPASSSASDNLVSRPSVVSQSSTSSKPQNVDDDVVEIRKPEIHPVSYLNRLQQPSDCAPLAPPDSDEYRAFLKSQLDLACAVAANSRGSSVKPEVNSSLSEDQKIANKNRQLESQISGNGIGVPVISKTPSEEDDGSRSIPTLPSVQKKQEAQVRQTTSGSSREDSDDDEHDGDTETNDLGPSDEKRARRMLSNRESARRSRRRKQAQLNEFETQVGQLRDERATLLTRLTDINKKCDDASVENRILNANIETLRTKVQMAEDQVKRVTGLNPLVVGRSSMGMQYGGGQRDASTNVAMPLRPTNGHYFHHTVPNIASGAPRSHIHGLSNSCCPDSNLTPLQPDNGTAATHPNMAHLPPNQHLTGPPLNHLPALGKVAKVNKKN